MKEDTVKTLYVFPKNIVDETHMWTKGDIQTKKIIEQRIANTIRHSKNIEDTFRLLGNINGYNIFLVLELKNEFKNKIHAQLINNQEYHVSLLRHALSGLINIGFSETVLRYHKER